MTSPLMKPTLVGRDTLHELDQPLKELAYVSNHWGPLLLAISLSKQVGYKAHLMQKLVPTYDEAYVERYSVR
ncbi:hypothetical protein COR52_23135 [Vibrio mediterranei]|uniref:Uncharacterized protein n=1 Tax=Vibrio mediterranei TaxID=689 RepID=A0ABX5D895_9VIBR|nr:hypothetical protein COR52_23135 [Vibrio mediterranei]PRQ65243.1 hypothetical protein COR51_23600 [Vibrio mediterranei]